MRNLLNRLRALPFKWRITVWVTLWMCVFFMLYNSVQYLVLDRWILAQEEDSIKKSMDEIQVYYANSGAKEISQGKSFLEKVNEKDEMIRIIDRDGNLVLIIGDEKMNSWVLPMRPASSKLRSLWHDQDHILVISRSIQAGDFEGTVEIVRNLENYEQLNHLLLLVMIIGGLCGIAISAFSGVLLGRQFVKPIGRLTIAIQNIKRRGLSQRVEFHNNGDELSQLSAMFNGMMDQLEEAFQQQHQFVEDASHELRTPIAILEGHLNLLKRWGKDDPAVLNESLHAALEELTRLKHLSQDLLAASESNAVSQEWNQADLSPLVIKIVDDFSLLHPEFAYDVDTQSLSRVKLAITEHHLKQILTIVIDNAIKYSRDKKHIRVTGTAVPPENHKHVQDHMYRVEIIDYGPGIPEEHLPHVFDRFYRADKARSRAIGGSGLGLAIAKKLVQKYEGTIRLSSSEQGTIAIIELPRSL
ncbi:HAMP domain-containing histidine kinase [Paenibacillus sp. HB172176]|uniref:sensor histidine kinase n=1 Tax=Paenibacillus sp. HB172176 TaxID=2493690 RepID=UPI0014387D14|nr:HAMP domain-containing histidine kinase [Paenibacillus sp. HB172176]